MLLILQVVFLCSSSRVLAVSLSRQFTRHHSSCTIYVTTVLARYLSPQFLHGFCHHSSCMVYVTTVLARVLSPQFLHGISHHSSGTVSATTVIARYLSPQFWHGLCHHSSCTVSVTTVLARFLSPQFLHGICHHTSGTVSVTTVLARYLSRQFWHGFCHHSSCTVSVTTVLARFLSPQFLHGISHHSYGTVFVTTVLARFLPPHFLHGICHHSSCTVSATTVLARYLSHEFALFFLLPPVLRMYQRTHEDCVGMHGCCNSVPLQYFILYSQRDPFRIWDNYVTPVVLSCVLLLDCFNNICSLPPIASVKTDNTSPCVPPLNSCRPLLLLSYHLFTSVLTTPYLSPGTCQCASCFCTRWTSRFILPFW